MSDVRKVTSNVWSLENRNYCEANSGGGKFIGRTTTSER